MIVLAESEGPDQTAQNAQAELGLRCLHMTKDTFSHGAAHISALRGSIN